MIGYCSKYGGTWGIPATYRHKTIYDCWPHLPKYKGRSLPVWSEPDFNFTEIPEHKGGVKLHGFFQSLKYFEHCQGEVRHWIRLKETPIERVGIHIRRGDYLQYADRFPTLSTTYIQNAIGYFINKGYYKFFIFSDDIEWCKQYFGKQEDIIIYSEGRNEFEDMSLLASCEHQIIANSTFSWMAAWYNTNKNKIVVCPSAETWFGPANNLKDKTFDLLPEKWIKIPNL